MSNKIIKSPKKGRRGKRVDPLIMKKEIINIILKIQSEGQITQTMLIEELGRTQMTIIRYISELKGEGVITEDRFGTSTIYSLTSLNALIEKNYANEIITEEIGPFIAKIGKYNDIFLMQFKIPSVISSPVIPIEGEQLLETLNNLDEWIVTFKKNVKKARKKIEKEIRGGE